MEEWLREPSFKSMERARQDLGAAKWDTATGTIAGLVAAVLMLSLIYGAPNLDSLPQPIFPISILIGGVAGYFFGKHQDERHFLSVRKLAFDYDAREAQIKRSIKSTALK